MIRPAVLDDLHPCVYIADVFHNGSQFSGVTTFIYEDAYEYALHCLNNSKKLFLVCEQDNKVISFFIAGHHHVPWNKDELISEEELFFILPSYKSPRIALRFFKEWESWCNDKNVRLMLFNPTSFVDDDLHRWDSFCNALGFQEGGKSYKKVLKRC